MCFYKFAFQKCAFTEQIIGFVTANIDFTRQKPMFGVTKPIICSIKPMFHWGSQLFVHKFEFNLNAI